MDRQGVAKLIKFLLLLPQNESLGITLIRKEWNRKLGKYFYKKKYSTKDIVDLLRGMGIGSGSNIFIHSSWSNFYNYTGNEEEFIDGVLGLIGPNGTLVMPCYPLCRKNKVFNVKKTVTKAGYLAEAFRRYPNVLRSANVRHSVAAIGPLAEFLTKDHAEDGICFDHNSPYYRMCTDNNFKIISFGLTPYFIGTIIHTLEGNHYNQFARFRGLYDFNDMIVNEYIDYDGELKSYKSPKETFQLRPNYFKTRRIVHKYFDKNMYRTKRISNLCVCMYDCNYTYERLVELAEKGIFIYSD